MRLSIFFVCLLFAVLPLRAQELVVPVSVTTNVAEFYPSVNLVNGSGLPGNLTAANYASASHAAASASNAWVTNAPGVDYYATATPPPVLVFSLGALHELTHFVVWGYHFGSPNNNEAKSFTLEFSTNGGATYANPVQVTHPRSAAAADTLSLGGTYAANTVRITITDNHYATAGAGGGDRVGLGEVRFLGTVPPNPHPIIDAPASYDFGAHPADPGLLQAQLAIANSGEDQPLQVTSAALRPGTPGAGYFTVTGAPLTVNAGASLPLNVVFNANGMEGCYFAILDLASNDPETPLVTVLLTAAVNCTPSAPEVPAFSLPSRTFSGTLSLTLSTTTAGAVILYTTDGSLPSASNGRVYDGPLSLTGTTQIRAATVVPGQAAAVATETYIRLAANVQTYISELPILVVENLGKGSIPDKGWTTASQTGGGLVQPERQPAALFLIDRDPTSQRAAMAALPDLRSRIGIRVRGAFSSTWNPKPYSIETWKKDSDKDRKVSPLGMPEESDWLLYFPHPSYDTSMLGNTFIWELGSRTGRYGTRFRFVDVFINEKGGDLTLADRKGVYAFAEQVKRDPERIDFEALSADGTTGGWLLGINRMDPIPASGYPTANGATSPQFFHTAGPDRIQQTPPNVAGQGDDIPRQYNAFINFDDPNGYTINTTQRATIEGWFREFEDVFYDNARWLDPVNGYRRHLDTRDFIDYFHLLNLGKQGDGLLLSMFPWVSSGERKLHMGPMWDFNNGAFSGSATGTLFYRSDRLWYPRLFSDPGYLREHIDRWYALRRGPLANAAMAALVDEQAARMPDSLVPGQGITLATWRSRVSAMKSWLATRADWIDSQWLAPPSLSWNAGSATVTLSHPVAGSLYYTLDGSDPIGSVGATFYNAPVSLLASVTVRTRLFTGTEWSALNEATYIVGVPASAANLVVSEIMYHPADPEAGGEFIELQNISSETIDLTGVAFTRGIAYVFPVGTTLAPGQRLVVREPDFLNGTRLANGGERLTLSDATGAVIRDFAYDDNAPWPEAADGGGFSLVLVRPASNPDHSNAGHWRRSTLVGGNPGVSDALAHVPGTSLLDYALGDAGAFSARVDADAILLAIPVLPGAEDAVVTVEDSGDLSTWTSVANASFRSATETVETYAVPVPMAGATRAYRLRVTLR